MQSIANLNEWTTEALGELPISATTHVPKKKSRASMPSRWQAALPVGVEHANVRAFCGPLFASAPCSASQRHTAPAPDAQSAGIPLPANSGLPISSTNASPIADMHAVG